MDCFKNLNLMWAYFKKITTILLAFLNYTAKMVKVTGVTRASYTVLHVVVVCSFWRTSAYFVCFSKKGVLNPFRMTE